MAIGDHPAPVKARVFLCCISAPLFFIVSYLLIHDRLINGTFCSMDLDLDALCFFLLVPG
jgi:hypothetical protein